MLKNTDLKILILLSSLTLLLSAGCTDVQDMTPEEKQIWKEKKLNSQGKISKRQAYIYLRYTTRHTNTAMVAGMAVVNPLAAAGMVALEKNQSFYLDEEGKERKLLDVDADTENRIIVHQGNVKIITSTGIVDEEYTFDIEPQRKYFLEYDPNQEQRAIHITKIADMEGNDLRLKAIEKKELALQEKELALNKLESELEKEKEVH